MIYYIHGCGSSLKSDTLLGLQKEMDVVGLTYDIQNPVGSINKLVDSIHDEHPIIIGSSIGGWFAEQLSNYISGSFVMYNPSTEPWDSLSKYGIQKEILDTFKSLDKPMRVATRVVIVSTDDEILNPELAIVKYSSNSWVEFTIGGHRMTSDNLKLIVREAKFLEHSFSNSML